MSMGLVADLKCIVGAEGVTNQPDRMSRYIGDALGPYRAFNAASRLFATPGAVVRPHDTEQISRILRYAQRYEVPVVPYGGGSGVSGAAAPIEGGIILSLERLNGAPHVSTQDQTARLQAGVVLEDAASALFDAGMILGHDPWSRPIATVGGAISTDGVGYTASRHGSMGDQVLGVEAVLADGEIIRTRATAKPTNGLSLDRLLIGSEGTFGVITEATVRAFPQPEERILVGVDFPNFEAGFRAICQMNAEGVRPAMIDYGTDSEFADETDGTEEATLYASFEGFREDAQGQWKRALDVCRRFEGRVDCSGEADRFWRSRHSAGERYKKNVLDSADPAAARRDAASFRMDYLHVALPVSRVLEYRSQCKLLFADRRIQVREWSIWARPEYFSFLIAQEEPHGSDSVHEMGSAVDEVLTLAQELGGSIEYCHGAGIKLSHLMESEHGSGLEVMRRIKRSVDPGNILNPGRLLG